MILEHFLFSIKNDANVIDFKDIKIIEKKAFSYDNTIEYLKIDNKLQIIGESACEKCNNLQIVEIGENGHINIDKESGTPEYKNAFIKKEEEHPITDILTIETKAFCDCSKLHTVILPTKKNIIIKADVFCGCAALRTIVFGSGVVEIHNQNFSDSSNVSFVCKPGTNAIAFAKKHGIRVINI